MLVGGFPGSGKTTLLKSLSDTNDLTIITWNAVRQALLDRNLKGTPHDWEIILETEVQIVRDDLTSLE